MMNRKTIILIFILLPVLVYGQAGTRIIEMAAAMKTAVQALKTQDINKLKQAEIRLDECLATANRGSRAAAQQIENLETLRFWVRVFINESETEPDLLPEKTGEPIIEDPVSENDGPDPEPETETADPDPETQERDFEELKGLLLSAIKSCRTGKFFEGEKPIQEFFETHSDGPFAPLQGFFEGYLVEKKNVIIKLMTELASREGDTVLYCPVGGGQYYSGRIGSVKGEIVYIKRDKSSMGVSFRTLAPGSLAQAAVILNHKEKIYLAFHLLLCGYKETEAGLFQYASQAEDETGKAFNTFHSILDNAAAMELVNRYMKMLKIHRRQAEAENYNSAFKGVLRISHLKQDVLQMLAEKYYSDTKEPLSQLLAKTMYECSSCGGVFHMDCAKCKGRGKVLENSPDDMLFGERQSLRIVKCSACNGRGKLYCRACSGRRFSKEANSLLKKLKEIDQKLKLEGDPE